MIVVAGKPADMSRYPNSQAIFQSFLPPYAEVNGNIVVVVVVVVVVVASDDHHDDCGNCCYVVSCPHSCPLPPFKDNQPTQYRPQKQSGMPPTEGVEDTFRPSVALTPYSSSLQARNPILQCEEEFEIEVHSTLST